MEDNCAGKLGEESFGCCDGVCAQRAIEVYVIARREWKRDVERRAQRQVVARIRKKREKDGWQKCHPEDCYIVAEIDMAMPIHE